MPHYWGMDCSDPLDRTPMCQKRPSCLDDGTQNHLVVGPYPVIKRTQLTLQTIMNGRKCNNWPYPVDLRKKNELLSLFIFYVIVMLVTEGLSVGRKIFLFSFWERRNKATGIPMQTNKPNNQELERVQTTVENTTKNSKQTIH